MNRIVLVLMVGNEERIVARCMGAALPHCDAWVLAYNGDRKDRTVEEADKVGSLLGKHGSVAYDAWENFGVNRTRSIWHARRLALELGWEPAETWALVLDADMVLQGSIDAARLSADGYELLQQQPGGLRYANLRLLRLSCDWRCVGVTHEYWTGGKVGMRLDTASIDDRNDGGCKGDKHARDIRLLTHALIDEPDNARYRFYLGDTLYHANRKREAIEHFEKRAELGGFEEERWFARYRLGQCLLRTGEEDRGMGVLLRAFDERPTRAEPLYELGRWLRERGRNHAAHAILSRAVRIEQPAKDRLFVETAVYERKILQELAIVSHYVGRPEEGRRICEALAATPGVNAEHIAATQSWYLKPVARSSEGVFDVGAEGYSPANPSIVRLPNGRELVNVRLVNYDQRGGRWYESREADKVIRTRNLLMLSDADGVWELDAGIPDTWPRDTRVRGLEDLRLCVHGGRVWFTATTCQVPGAGGSPRVVLGRLDEKLRRVEHLVPLAYASARDVEKNWLPWSSFGKSLLLVYSYDPLIVLDSDPETGECTELPLRMQIPGGARWRGSAGPLVVGDRVIAVVHEVARRESENVYGHRLVALASVGSAPGPDAPVSYSEPFCLAHQGIEYLCGAVATEDGGLKVTFGVEDREARWLVIPRTEIERLLPRKGNLKAA